MSEKTVTIGARQIDLQVERDGSRLRSGANEIEIVAMRENEAELRVDGKVFLVPFVGEGGRISFAFDGDIYVADVTARGARAKTRHRDHSMAAPMPGLVLKILVKAGDVVTKGAPLIVLEAMKMEHQIVAPRDGTVAAVRCVEGELVQPGVDLIEITSSSPADTRS